MMRRRFRLFAFCATAIVFLLYRAAQNSWDQPLQHVSSRLPQSLHHDPPVFPAPEPHNGDKLALGLDAEHGQPPKQDEESIPSAKSEKGPQHVSGGAEEQGSHRAKPETPPAKMHKESMQIHGDGRTKKDETEELLNLHPSNPSRTSPNGPDGAGTPFKKHWQPVSEHFPIPPDSVRPLPAIPKLIDIPKIQFEFKGTEPDDIKERRIKRRDRVKQEIKRAWSGYKKFAWLHDELRPVSGKFRDPFCSWAATLVDSLDTLWLAGLHEEFDEAAHAVTEIDFTYSPRNGIPVFETTIRYLGGLIGAVDVSGGPDGKYSFLLNKAVELANILMGIFDTPNRMPVLYYQWQPEYASQPHLAGFVGMAELATLSLEFTRLAQLTGEKRYYDAVDRITDALVEMQKAGTAIPGLFPEKIDASGCNHSTPDREGSISRKAQAQLSSPELLKQAVGYIEEKVLQEEGAGKTLSRRGGVETSLDDGSATPRIPRKQTPTRVLENKPPFAADGTTVGWDCHPQGLVPGLFLLQDFHIGGGQDSAYEYFQKQYLLLGGSEEKYKKLHLDSVKAIDEWLLYRPMIKDDRDILFTAKLSTNGDPKSELFATFEITHLSCFVGGMYAMSGKLFQREKDIETAARLTDGCVWAYEITPSGIMPESARILPCPKLDKCEFNETAWWDGIDPLGAWRDRSVAEWEEEWSELANRGLDHGEEELEAGSELSQALKDRNGWDQGSKKAMKLDSRSPSRMETSQEDDDDSEKRPSQLNSVLEANRLPPLPSEDAPVEIPARPESHKEYVQAKIDKYKYPPGFTSIGSPSYILRPEAVESVFYMYRITGDPQWQEKGWKMFEATIRATRTEFANSAIANVFDDEPELKDEMESFWLAETLKYYYLLFCDADVANLDEWVFNTEAHPFKRPR